MLQRARKQFEQLLGPSLSESPPGSPSKQLECEPGEVWHFAYGANTAFGTLQRRGVRPIARESAFIVDPAIRMRFRHRGGYATLEAMPLVSSPGGSPSGGSPSGTRKAAVGASEGVQQQAEQQQDAQQQLLQHARPRYPPFDPHVHGVLYRLRAEDMEKLKKAEGGYVVKEIEVQTYDGRRALAQTFVSGPLAMLPAEVPPTEKYMRALREGAADNYLDPLHQAWLSSVETVSSAGLGPEYYNTPSKFIAYGFLAIVALMVVGFFAQH